MGKTEHHGGDENVAQDDAEAPSSVGDEWADEYEPGTQLFGATFDADDFDTEYGEAFPDGTTVAVKRCISKPPPGWIRQHAHLSDLERTFALLERHCSDRALEILDSLKEEPWSDFLDRWGKDGGLVEGKSRRFSRRSGK